MFDLSTAVLLDTSDNPPRTSDGAIYREGETNIDMRNRWVRGNIVYTVSVSFAGSAAVAFSRFGGDIDQFSKMALIPQLAIVENPPIASQYDIELQNMIARYARERAHSANYYELPPTHQNDILRAIQQRREN